MPAVLLIHRDAFYADHSRARVEVVLVEEIAAKEEDIRWAEEFVPEDEAV